MTPYQIILSLAALLLIFAAPTDASEFLAPDASAIEYLWQGRVAKSPEVRKAVLSVSDISYSQKKAISQFNVLPYLGNGWSKQDPFHHLTDFPERVQGGTVPTMRQAAYDQFTPLLRREAKQMVSEWHDYEIEYLRDDKTGIESKVLKVLRANLVTRCGHKGVEQAEKVIGQYTPSEVALIVKSKGHLFPQPKDLSIKQRH